MAKKSTQEKIFQESVDESIAVAADKYVELLDEKDQLKEDIEKAQEKLIVEMNKKMKYKIRHHGRIFELVNTDPKQKIKVKDAEPGKAEK